ncbi:hypothetical protein ACO1O0_008494 [Amphichorda felina]
MVIKNIQNSRKTTKGAHKVQMSRDASRGCDFEPNRHFLSAALEIVVTSRRRLTWDELAYAIALALVEANDLEDEDPYLSTLADVQDLSDIDMGTRASEQTEAA